MNRKKHTNYPAIISFCIAFTFCALTKPEKDKLQKKRVLKRSHSVRGNLKTSLKRTKSVRLFTESHSASTITTQKLPLDTLTENMDPQNQFQTLSSLIKRSPQRMIELLEAIPYADERCFVYDQKKTTLLHIAAQYGNSTIIKQLIEKGLDVDTVDSKNESAIYVAARYGNFDAFEILLKKGAQTKEFLSSVLNEYCSVDEVSEKKYLNTILLLLTIEHNKTMDNTNFINHWISVLKSMKSHASKETKEIKAIQPSDKLAKLKKMKERHNAQKDFPIVNRI